VFFFFCIDNIDCETGTRVHHTVHTCERTVDYMTRVDRLEKGVWKKFITGNYYRSNMLILRGKKGNIGEHVNDRAIGVAEVTIEIGVVRQCQNRQPGKCAQWHLALESPSQRKRSNGTCPGAHF